LFVWRSLQDNRVSLRAFAVAKITVGGFCNWNEADVTGGADGDFISESLLGFDVWGLSADGSDTKFALTRRIVADRMEV